MSAIICPWCQSEIMQEEGAEPEKWCPVCENELDGYRTLTIDIGGEEEAEDGEAGNRFRNEEDLPWVRDKELREKNEALLQFEEQVERLLDEQDVVPECPHCREYMVEAGERTVEAGSFRPRVLGTSGHTVLDAPFSWTVYVCPSCFAVTQALSEEGRLGMLRRLSGGRA